MVSNDWGTLFLEWHGECWEAGHSAPLVQIMKHWIRISSSAFCLLSPAPEATSHKFRMTLFRMKFSHKLQFFLWLKCVSLKHHPPPDCRTQIEDLWLSLDYQNFFGTERKNRWWGLSAEPYFSDFCNWYTGLYLVFTVLKSGFKSMSLLTTKLCIIERTLLTMSFPY